MLFIPGFMQRGDAWRPVAELLPERYPSVLLDHRAHSFESRLAEIAAAGEGRVLVGYRWAAGWLCAALRDPDRYAGVVTLGATAGIEEPTLRSARAEADERLAAWMEVTPIEDIVGIWERQPLFADQPESLIEEQRAGRPRPATPAELALILRTAGQGVLEPVWHELLRLELPVLQRRRGPRRGRVERSGRIADAAPRGRHEVIEDAGRPAAHLQSRGRGRGSREIPGRAERHFMPPNARPQT